MRLIGLICMREHVETNTQNIPALPVSDWSVVRIYPRFLRRIGPLVELRAGESRFRGVLRERVRRSLEGGRARGWPCCSRRWGTH
eukprot:1195083-Prorocentrum_minimum.AAC.6